MDTGNVGCAATGRMAAGNSVSVCTARRHDGGAPWHQVESDGVPGGAVIGLEAVHGLEEFLAPARHVVVPHDIV